MFPSPAQTNGASMQEWSTEGWTGPSTSIDLRLLFQTMQLMRRTSSEFSSKKRAPPSDEFPVIVQLVKLSEFPTK